MCRYLLVFLLVSSFSVLSSALEVADVFSDHMVLQRDRPIKVWGWADPETEIMGTLGSESLMTKSNAEGKWRLVFSSLPASKEPISLTLKSEEESIILSDILVGEVWVCSGQSNMQWAVQKTLRGAETLAHLNEPLIRLFNVPRRESFEPQVRIQTKWTLSTDETVSVFPAVGFYYGQILQSELDIPIGLIASAYGGTPAEAWTEISYLRGDPELEHHFKNFMIAKQDGPDGYYGQLEQWEESQPILVANNIGLKKGWNKELKDKSKWSRCELPGLISKHIGKEFDGSVWYRKEIELDGSWEGQHLTLELGVIDDIDETYINGHLVGSVGIEREDYWKTPRVYEVKPEWIKSGKNVIAVRVIDVYKDGGFISSPREMKLSAVGSEKEISLAGDWMFRYEQHLRVSKPKDISRFPSVLYNSMIHPLVGFPIRGVIWYQGESNSGRPDEYSILFPTLIQSWRNLWGQGDFPFYFVQLANFKQMQRKPVEKGWAYIRESQLQTLRLPKTGMAVTLDIGEADDIHPRNKFDVAYRLAVQALHHDYGICKKYETYSGPIYDSMEIKGDKIYLSFKHVGKGLVAHGDELKGFAIAGEDKVFVWADAVIEGNKIVVSSEAIKEPRVVRYAWATNPVGNLYNQEGFPATSFRTDSF